ncbi:hypothetical protein AKO1_007366 [Acrasis kona]|uniref:Phytanoyl-CoA dioxygenase n=1 Tax=Acrasis kona TaxID=1008807 RepID=A0AAW2YSD3_9EUKA
MNPVTPTSDEIHEIVVEKIMQREEVIHNVGQQNNPNLFNFLYHFEEHGWAIYKSMYSEKMADDVVSEANTFIKRNHKSKFDMTRSSTYNEFPFGDLGFVPLYHLNSLYEMRTYKPMVDLFKVIYNTEDIRSMLYSMSFKRSKYELLKNKKVVERPEWGHDGFMHHDMNLVTGEAVIPVQCVVALSDTTEDMGGWHGIDYFHWNAREWALSNDLYCKKLTSLSSDKVALTCPKMPDVHLWANHIVKPIMNKGDILVWKAELAHGSGSNESKLGRPRIAAYINYAPSDHLSDCVKRDLIECFYSGKRPNTTRDDGLEREHHKVYNLKNESDGKLFGL